MAGIHRRGQGRERPSGDRDRRTGAEHRPAVGRIPAGTRDAQALVALAKLVPPRAIELVEPKARHSAAFLAAVRRSRALHRPWLSPASTPEAYREYVARFRKPTHQGWLVATPDEELAGFINVNEIVQGGFRSGYLGYGAFVPYEGKGYLSAGLRAVLRKAFRELRLHRLEANIQPGNQASLALVERLGFAKEGYSPRYLKIGGRWRDHERWALTVESWRKRDA